MPTKQAVSPPSVTWTNIYTLRTLAIRLNHNPYMPGGVGFPHAGDQWEYVGNRKFGANNASDLYSPNYQGYGNFVGGKKGLILFDSSDFTWTLRTGGDSFFGGNDQVHGRAFLPAGAKYLSYDDNDPPADNFYYTETQSSHGWKVDVWWEYPNDNLGVTDPIYIANASETVKVYVQMTAVLEGNSGDVNFIAFDNKGDKPGSKLVTQGLAIPQVGRLRANLANGFITKQQFLHEFNHGLLAGGGTYRFSGYNPDAKTETQGIGTVTATLYDNSSDSFTVIHAADSGGINHILPGINVAGAEWTFGQYGTLSWLPSTVTIPVGPQSPAPFPNAQNPGWSLSCFVGDTKISMADGTSKEICDITVGDEVVSVDTGTGEKVQSSVTEISEHTETPNYINVNDGELRGTSNHEMYDGTQWKPLGDFRKGDTIQMFDGSLRTINNLRKTYVLTTTYNFEVDSEHHNYFANGYLAHNKSQGWLGPGGFWVGGVGSCCFIGSTKVSMADGTYKRIDEVEVGEEVKTHKGTNVVTHIEEVELKYRALYDINNTGEFFITEDHVVKTDNGWKSINPKLTKILYPKLYDLISGQLRVGDIIITEDGPVKIFNLNRHANCDPQTTVYDISIKDDETLFANGFLAHNHGSYLFRQRYPKPRNPFIPPPPPVPPVPEPCNPTGNPPVNSLMIANTAAGKHITSNPKFVGHSGSDGKIKFFQPINPARLSNRASEFVHSKDNCVPEGILTATLTLPKSGRNVEGGTILWHYKTCTIFLGVNKDGYVVTLSDPRHRIGPSDQSTDLAFGEIELNGIAKGPLGSTTLLSISSNSGNASTTRGYDGWGEFQLEDIAYTHNAEVYNRRDTLYGLVSSAGDSPTTKSQYEAFAYNIGSVDYNYKTHQFGRVTFSNIPLTVARTLTAESTGGLGDESVAYVPRGNNGEPRAPLIAMIGDSCTGYETVSSVTEWIVQGSNFGNNTNNIGMSAEWPDCEKPSSTFCPTLSSRIRSVPFVGGLNPPPIYRRTTQTIAGSANGEPYTLQGYVATHNLSLTRPRRRLPVAGCTSSLYHNDHAPRSYDLFCYKFDNRAYQEVGYEIVGSSRVPALSSKVFSMTYGSYMGTTNPQVTSCRINFEHNNNPNWDIAEFSDFTSLSAFEFATFLANVAQTSITHTLTADIPFVQLIGFVTYNGSLTAADGSYYAMALTRGKKPVWVEAPAQIGLFGTSMGIDHYDNYVIVTSGKDLFLPYLTYREKLSD